MYLSFATLTAAAVLLLPHNKDEDEEEETSWCGVNWTHFLIKNDTIK